MRSAPDGSEARPRPGFGTGADTSTRHRFEKPDVATATPRDPAGIVGHHAVQASSRVGRRGRVLRAAWPRPDPREAYPDRDLASRGAEVGETDPDDRDLRPDARFGAIRSSMTSEKRCRVVRNSMIFS